jgi:predicted nucleic acid-binding protein
MRDEASLVSIFEFPSKRKQGTPIPTNDLWIAALTLQHDLLLFTRDTHFNHLPQLPVI